LRNQFFEALMSPPAAATKLMMPIHNEKVPDSPQPSSLLQQQLSLLKEKQANNAVIRAQEEARGELEDARRAVARAFDVASELGEFAPKPVVVHQAQSPIPGGPVAAKVAEAFGAVSVAGVARKESRDLYGTPSSNYKFLDLPSKVEGDVNASGGGGGGGEGGGAFGKMPPPPSGLYPVAIRMPSTSTQPSSNLFGIQPVAFEAVSKPSATAVYGFSSQATGLSRQEVIEKEKKSAPTMISSNSSSVIPKPLGSSPPKVISAINSLHPMPTALPSVTWDTHVIPKDEFMQSDPRHQQVKKDSNENVVTEKRQVLDMVGDLSSLPNLYSMSAVASNYQQQYQQPTLPQSRSNLPSAVAMMGKPRPISATSSSYSHPLTAPASIAGSIASEYALSTGVNTSSGGGSVLSVTLVSDASLGSQKKKNTPIPSIDAARNSPRFSFGRSAEGYDLSRDAYQSYDKEAQYKKRGSTPLPISFSASAVAAKTKI